MRRVSRRRSQNTTGSVRLWRRDDEHHREILQILSRIWAVDISMALQRAADPERQIWLWVNEGDKPFRGLVIISSHAPALFSLENAFVSHAQRQLLQDSRANIFHIELIWARCGVCEPNEVVRRVLGEMSQRLRASDDDKMMVCPIADTKKNRALGAALQALGFSVHGHRHVDFLLQLSAGKAESNTNSANSSWFLHSFADPPDVDSLIACVAKVFPHGLDKDGTGHQRAGELIESSIGDINFDIMASYYLIWQGQVAGFVWVFREETGPARLGLAALVPELRQQGLARQAFARLSVLWSAQGHQSLHFSIAEDNDAALNLAKSIAAGQKSSRETWLWTNTQ